MFVVCGEALMDVFGAGDTAAGMALDARVGGSPFNAAVGLARLAQPVTFLSAVSRGFLGERLMRALVAEGVNTSAVQRNDAPTTLGLVGLDANRVPSYSFYGEGCADRQLTADALAALPQGVRAIHLGSYATVVEPIASTLRTLVVVTRGAEGAVAWTPQAHASVPTVQVEVIDTVGAGDTFQAALLTWLAEHAMLSAAALQALSDAELESALGFAARAAAITCS